MYRILPALTLALLWPALGLAQPAAAAKPDWANHPENAWVLQSPRSGQPAPRFGWEGSGSYDPYQRKWIHFGGHDGVPQGFHVFTFDLDTGQWEQKFANTSPPGVCCVDGANVFDLGQRRFVRFPGASLGHGYQWSRGVKLKSAHVWLYDLNTNTWMNMRPPPYQPFLAREGLGALNAAATYDQNHELAISFGGQGNAGGTNNLFAYDAYANRLYRLPAANPPEHRDGMGLAYDAKNDCLVMFGSQYGNDEKTWIYRYAAGKWEGHDLKPRPVGKKLGTYSTMPKMAYDSRHELCLCLVWDTNSNKHETWAFDAAKLQWTKLDPRIEPDPSMSRSRNLSYDAERNVFILETSSKEGKGNAPQIWTYRFKKAAPDPRPAAPTNLHVSTNRDKALISWTASASPVKSYPIYRARADEPWKTSFTKIGTTDGTNWEDRDLTAGQICYYVVRAVGMDGTEGPASFRARTQPRVSPAPVVSVLALDKIEVSWKAHPAKDVVGYNLYRGVALMRSVTKGTPKPWRDNDPEYPEPTPVEVRDLTDIQKLNDQPLTATTFTDAKINLMKKDVDKDEYRFHVHAYLIKAVNRLGVESGPSPYALTIPSAPAHVLNREKGPLAELKWQTNPEKGIAGYRIYKLEGTWNIVRLTDEPIKATTFTHKGGTNTTRYWVVAVDALGQEGEPSSPVWHHRSYKGFFAGDWRQ